MITRNTITFTKKFSTRCTPWILRICPQQSYKGVSVSYQHSIVSNSSYYIISSPILKSYPCNILYNSILDYSQSLQT